MSGQPTTGSILGASTGAAVSSIVVLPNTSGSMLLTILAILIDVTFVITLGFLLVKKFYLKKVK